MKQFIKHTPYLVSLLILLGITSCTKMDEYLKYRKFFIRVFLILLPCIPVTTGWSSAEYWHPTLK